MDATANFEASSKKGESESFLILAANPPWVYSLGEALADRSPVHCVRIYDWLNYRRMRSDWPTKPPPAQMERSIRAFPPGYAGALEWLTRPFLRRMINDWFGASALAAGRYPFVICPYPYLAPWLRDIPNEKIVYYNLDEYTLYNPSRAKLIRVQEDNLVSRSALVLCLAQHQVAALRKRHPEKAESIVHFPLGVDEAYILPDPKLVATANIVGYIGNLTDRVDWRFVAEVAERSPQAVFVFVGELVAGEDGRDKRWRDMRAEVLSRPNVRHYGLVDQQEVAPLYWSFAVNWMPYDVPHPFNVASCPTKIMDSIAAGRPFISTAIPEVELYPDQIWIARSAREAAELISGFLGGSLAHDMVGQLAFARNNTWRHRATELRRLLAALRPNSY